MGWGFVDVGFVKSFVGWAGDSQPNKTRVLCITLGCQKAATQPTRLVAWGEVRTPTNTLNNDALRTSAYPIALLWLSHQ
jgi:hypothetical protein